MEMGLSWTVCVFFFQAEDGIRDTSVTGVQTCALPIYGSPGARARIVKRMRLIPTRTGIEISVRRIRYFNIERTGAGRSSRPPRARLGLLPPVGHVPEVRIPPALCRVAQTRRDRGDARTPDDGDDHDILDKEVVHFDEERGALDRVHLGLGRLPGPVVLVVAPAHDVPPLPLVRLRGDFPGDELVHEALRVRLGHRRRVPLDARRSVEEVGGGDAGPAVDLLLDRAPVDQEIQRLADGEIREERMPRLDRRLLALHLRPRVGLVELDVLDVATEGGVDAALAALLEALEDVVLHL